jgi:hypothetical protein
MMLIYQGLALLAAVLLVQYIFRQEDFRLQLLAAFTLIPFLLRACLIA